VGMVFTLQAFFSRSARGIASRVVVVIDRKRTDKIQFRAQDHFHLPHNAFFACFEIDNLFLCAGKIHPGFFNDLRCFDLCFTHDQF
jgi:hypothetical protein